MIRQRREHNIWKVVGVTPYPASSVERRKWLQPRCRCDSSLDCRLAYVAVDGRRPGTRQRVDDVYRLSRCIVPGLDHEQDVNELSAMNIELVIKLVTQ